MHLRVYSHDNLIAGGAFEVFQLAVQPARRRRVHDIRVIIEIMLRRGRDDFRSNRGKTPQPKENETETAHGVYGLAGAGAGWVLSKLNCTLGAFSEPAEAAKYGLF